MIHVISAENRHLYEDVLEQHFRVRHEIFVEERKWEALRKPDSREIDVYDNEDAIYLLALENRRVLGGSRLYPTTKPTMMSEVFPHLAAVRGCPVDPQVWEWSRFFVTRERRDGAFNLQLMAAAQEFCLDQGIERLSLRHGDVVAAALPRHRLRRHAAGIAGAGGGLLDHGRDHRDPPGIARRRARPYRHEERRPVRTDRVSIASPVPTSAAAPPRNERAPEMSNMMRDSQIMAQTKDENLGYMSDMALELAQMAEDTGLATLAYLFRMAALEASTANSELGRAGRSPPADHVALDVSSFRQAAHPLPGNGGRVIVWVRQADPSCAAVFLQGRFCKA